VVSFLSNVHEVDQYDEDSDIQQFKDIVDHEGPLNPNHPNYKGSKYNLRIEWEDGDYTFEPLCTIGADDPVSVAIYANQNNLLDEPGFKRFRRIAREQASMSTSVFKSYQAFNARLLKFKFGYQVPNNHQQAMVPTGRMRIPYGNKRKKLRSKP
jgi:hypothetical protein